MAENKAKAFLEKHAELWKFIKFSIMGVSSTIIEVGTYYLLQFVVFRSLTGDPVVIKIGGMTLFEYAGLGYFYAYLISTAVGYGIAFILNRKITFKADANPTRSIILYVMMVIATIIINSFLGVVVTDWFINRGWQTVGELIVKPILTVVPTLWTYPLNRFVIHRHKKPEADTTAAGQAE